MIFLTPHCRREQIDDYIGSSTGEVYDLFDATVEPCTVGVYICSSLEKCMTLLTPHYRRVQIALCVGSGTGKMYDHFDASYTSTERRLYR
jgi:hypothetical protein